MEIHLSEYKTCLCRPCVCAPVCRCGGVCVCVCVCVRFSISF